MKVAFIMDPLESVKPWKDTSYFMMLAAVERGHEVFQLDQTDMRVIDSAVHATVSHVDVHPVEPTPEGQSDDRPPFTVKSVQSIDLGTMDAVFVRTDPPFDRTYFYTTLLLDLLPSSTQIVNRPSGLRNWNEKLAALYYPEFTPDTTIARDVDSIVAFARRHGRVTLKPIDGHGGQGIHFINDGDADIVDVIETVTRKGSHWIIAQEYLPEASAGDKRILLLDGEPMGAILRLHGVGQELNNLDQGGSANPTELTSREVEICAGLKEGLVREGIIFSGIDVIGDKLIEINVTSPTGLQEMSRFADTAFHHQLIERLERTS